MKGMALVRAELARMLENEVLPLEAGFAVLPDGMRMIASLHHVRGVTRAMFEWWIDSPMSRADFLRWHPHEHVSYASDDARGVSIARHRFDGVVETTRLQRRAASDYFDPEALSRAGLGAVCSRGGPGEGDGWSVHVVHLCCDTDFGCRVRTRMFLGDFDPAPPEPLRALILAGIGDALLARLVRHQCEEFTYLAGFLPELYARETAE